jgi:Phenylalanyl-tRNA synthetase beta subunit
LSLCLKRMAAWTGGKPVNGILDVYPHPQADPVVSLSEAEIVSALGAPIPLDEAADILTRLGFICRIENGQLSAHTPATRLDIGDGIIGKANLIEEISRVYGYDRLPATRLSAELPAQVGNPKLEMEEHIRDILVSAGLQDTVAYRQTSPEREARLLPENTPDPTLEYVRLRNPITPDRTVMRRSSLATMLELLEHNHRFRPGLAMFELGPVFLPVEGQLLPVEGVRLTIGMTGAREYHTWQSQKSEQKASLTSRA